MRVRPVPAAVALLGLLTVQPSADTRSTRLVVRTTVVRSCLVDTAPERGIALTCARGATPGVVTGESTRVIPVPPLQTIVIAEPLPAQPSESQARRVLVVNY